MDLKEAIKVLVNEEHLGDFIYNIRDRVNSSGERFEGSSWDHPRVKRFSDAVKALEDYIKE